MSITAKHLSKSGARGKDLDSVVREHLQIIDDKLLRVNRVWGRNVVSHDLPMILSLPGLDKKDAQRIVYSSILRSLDKRGFETRIVLDANYTTIFIAWMTDLDVDEVEAMNAILRAKKIEKDTLNSFIQKGSMPAPRTRQGVPGQIMNVSELSIMQPRGGACLAREADGSLHAEQSQSASETALLGRI